MRFSLLVSITVCSLSIAQQHDEAQQETQRFIFLPGSLAVPPLTAHHEEPRVGLRKEIGSSKMKLDIGASVDLLEIRPSADSLERFRIGVEFFTYALSTNSEGLRLQIDAVDGFFGGHIEYLSDLGEKDQFVLRLRLLHLSAHFLDGHFNNGTQTWKDGRKPIPFTRDFGELVALFRSGPPDIQYRLYGGLSYATLLRPVEIGRIEFLAGVELRSSSLVCSVFGKPFNVFVAHNLTLRELKEVIGSNTVDIGMKFGEWNSTGVKLYLSYFNGLDFFSQYYDERREHWALGVAFDFW